MGSAQERIGRGNTSNLIEREESTGTTEGIGLGIFGDKKLKKEKSKYTAAAVKPKKRKSSSLSGASGRSEKKRQPVKPAVVSDDSNEEDSSGTSEVEHDHVLQLW